MSNFTNLFVNQKTGKIETIGATKITALDVRAGSARVGAAEMPGTDTNFFVSGSVESKASGSFGVSVFGGDVVISGSLYGGSPLEVRTPLEGYQGLSGSLTQLTDGRSYLVEGNQVQITSQSNGQIVIGGTFGDPVIVSITQTNDITTLGTDAGTGNERVLFSTAEPGTTPTLNTNVPESGISFASSAGTFTVDNAGTYFIAVAFSAKVSATTQYDVRIKVNGVTKHTKRNGTETSGDPDESTSMVILDLSANDIVTVTYEDDGTADIFPNTGTSISIFRAGPGGNNSGWTDDGAVVRLTTSSDKVGIGDSDPSAFGSDVYLYVSGSSRNDTTGVTVFGGDVVISGTLHGGSPLKIATEGIKLGDQRIHQTEPGKITLGENVHFDSESLHFGDHKIKDEGGFLKFDSNNFKIGDHEFSHDAGVLHFGNQDQDTKIGDIRVRKNTLSTFSERPLILGADTHDFVIVENKLVVTGSTCIIGDIDVEGCLRSLHNSITGSLQKVMDGSSYLAAGAGINIVTQSNGQIVISTSGTEIGTIGESEDADYSDGLFTDFNTSTPIGTAVDRFNEVLKSLAPGPAPSLSQINATQSGASSKLSFGATSEIAGYNNVKGVGDFTPGDINSPFLNAIFGSDVRLGAINASTNISGKVNDHVAADSVNYPADCFGDANTGELILEINGVEQLSINLDDPSSDKPETSFGTYLSASAPFSAHFEDGSELDVFKHRLGTFLIHSDDMSPGHNYARVIHRKTSADVVTNYIDWVVDDYVTPIAASNSLIQNLSMTGDKKISGVSYHTGGTADYSLTVDNAYKNVYSNSISAITFTGLNCAASYVSPATGELPEINVSTGENETKSLSISALLNVNASKLLNGSITASTNVLHPISEKSLTLGGTKSVSNLLVYNLSDTATDTFEPLRGEDYRLPNKAYDGQSDVDTPWDSNESLLLNDGLLVYDEKLVSPINGVNGGDFSSVANGPVSNVDYSGIASGARTYYRKFKNNAGGSKTNFTLTFAGVGQVVPAGTSLASTNKFTVAVKLPQNSENQSTGWMDLALPFSTGEVGNGAGCLVGTLGSMGQATEGTFGTQFLSANDYLVMKIEADASWTGNISSITLNWV